LIKIAVIGLGNFGKLHANNFLNMRGVDLYAVCDSDKSKLDAFEKEEIEKYTDYKEILQKSNIQAVDIVVNEKSHYALVKEALTAGKHVIVEKPLAVSSKEAEELLMLSKTSGLLLMVGHTLRFDNRYAQIKQEIETGTFGEIVSFYARRNYKPSTFEKYSEVHPFLSSTIHDIDLFNWLIGGKVVKIHARQSFFLRRMMPDATWAMLVLDTGAVGFFENVSHLPENSPFKNDYEVEIIGTNETAFVRHFPDIEIWSNSQMSYFDFHMEAHINDNLSGALRSELEYFAGCIEKNEQPNRIPPEEAVEAVKIAEAMIDSANKGFSINCDFLSGKKETF